MDSNEVNDEESQIKLSNDLSGKIDSLVGELKKSLLNSPYNSRGVFDKVKNWWQNLTKGADNTNNPYYFQNKFGSLGKANVSTQTNQDPREELNKEPESKEDDDGFSLGVSRNESKLTLKEYKFLFENFNSLDSKISLIILNEQDYASNNLKNLEIFKIIDSWAVNFKREIFKMIGLPLGSASVGFTKAAGQYRKMAGEAGQTVNKEFTDVTGVNKSVNFKGWIRNESNMEIFVNLVNKIFNSPLYKRPIPIISNTLENKYNIKSPQKGEEGAALSISIRNKIIGIIQKEIEYEKNESNSIFSEKVWSWAKGLKQFVKKPTETEDSPSRGSDVVPRGSDEIRVDTSDNDIANISPESFV